MITSLLKIIVKNLSLWDLTFKKNYLSPHFNGVSMEKEKSANDT